MIAMWQPVLAQGDLIVSRSSLEVTGTSTLHDWEMKSDKITGQSTFIMKDEALTDVKDLRITVPAKNLKSGKDAMDNNAYKSLKTDKNPSITFQSTRVVGIEKAGNEYIANVEGKLSIAGVTKTVTMKATCAVNAGSGVHCKGEYALKMTDFKVEPPTFMFGSIKTGDEIKVHFDVTFSSNSIVSIN